MILIAFSILGYVFIGLVAGLANVITNEYVDYSLPGNPVVCEYDFRMGGKYGMITLFLLSGGVALAFGGSTIGIYTFYEPQGAQKHSKQRKIRSKAADFEPFVMCDSCGNKLPMGSKFCPKCGTDIKVSQILIPA